MHQDTKTTLRIRKPVHKKGNKVFPINMTVVCSCGNVSMLVHIGDGVYKCPFCECKSLVFVSITRSF